MLLLAYEDTAATELHPSRTALVAPYNLKCLVSRAVAKSGNGIEIVNPDDPDQDNGTKLLNYCIVISP
ncbi:hypothetical protein TNCV_2044761 [Trichonephila clavipes]|nr:hypothetical protein TNCV_2044761 [Trichonephila clavipes]